jgi:glycosyltransferase involved in cell wall biosynthesis
MLKIAMDCRVLQNPGGGISRFIMAILMQLKNEFEFHLLFANKNKVPEVLSNDKQFHIHAMGPTINKTYFIWDHISLPLLLKHIKPDIYHAPANDGLPFFKMRGVLTMVTLHDIIAALYPGDYKFYALFKWHIGIRLAVRRADLIQFDSDYMQKECSRYFKITCRNCVRTHLFVENSFAPQLDKIESKENLFKKLNLRSPYIVYHGGFMAYKNVNQVIRVFEHLRQHQKRDLQLCLVGRLDGHFKKNVESLIQDSPYKSDIVTAGYLPDEDLSILLSYTRCFLFLSAIEGFGFPPLEAMACGAPVVCRQMGSLPECMGEAALWVEENDSIDLIADKVNLVLKDKTASDALKREGEKRIPYFRLDRFRERMADVYYSMVNGKSNKI